MSASSLQSLLAEAEGSIGELGAAVTLPPAVFTDRDWFDAERRMMHGTWIAICRSSDVAAANDFVARDVLGEPVVVVRGRDDVLRAFSNVCRHRATTIVEGSGSAASLQCPYHLWTYRYDGMLLHAPSMEAASNFDASSICLPEFTVNEWHGWVLVSLDPPTSSMTESSPTLDAMLSEHRVAEMTSVGSLPYPSPWNWKITIENFLESYHHRGVHPETLESTFPGIKSFSVQAHGEPWSAIDHLSVIEGIDPFVAIVAFPTLMFAVLRGVGMLWFRVEPVSVNETQLTIEVFALPELAEQSEVVEFLVSSAAAVNAEDIPINARTSLGLHSRFATPGRISHLEEPTLLFRRWLIARITDGLPSGS
jgi:nitrite reductase/ring-hydroxylating ferredoxin subunit